MANEHSKNDHAHSGPHVGSPLVYIGVFLVLVIGTLATVAAAFQNWGMFNAPAALLIATIKAVCVILFFMHVKDSNKLTKTTVIAAAFWLGILFTLTMTDFATRAWK